MADEKVWQLGADGAFVLQNVSSLGDEEEYPADDKRMILSQTQLAELLNFYHERVTGQADINLFNSRFPMAMQAYQATGRHMFQREAKRIKRQIDENADPLQSVVIVSNHFARIRVIQNQLKEVGLLTPIQQNGVWTRVTGAPDRGVLVFSDEHHWLSRRVAGYYEWTREITRAGSPLVVWREY